MQQYLTVFEMLALIALAVYAMLITFCGMDYSAFAVFKSSF